MGETVTDVLALEGVSVHHGAICAVADVSLAMTSGDFFVLLGPSGSGKSTLLRVLLGLQLPDQGVVRIQGEIASAAGKLHIPPEERNLSVVFQDLALWPHMSAEGNLRFILRSRNRTPAEEDRDRIATILEQVGLRGLEKRYPGQLSGGEQQRLAIARALVVSPAAVLLDEPLANLDVALKTELIELFRSLFRGKTSALYVTHDPREAFRLSQRFLVLESGKLTHDGTLNEMRQGAQTPFIRMVLTELASEKG